MGEVEFVSSADTSTFNWKATHPRFGTVTHAILFGRVDYTEEDESNDEEDEEEEEHEKLDSVNGYRDFISDIDESVKQRLTLLQVAMERGADPYLVAPGSCNASRRWSKAKNKNTAYVTFADKSVIQCLWAIKRAIKVLASADWAKVLANINRAIGIIAGASGACMPSKVLVSERLLEMWEQVLADAETADVLIKVASKAEVVAPAGGCAAVSEVRAHSAVLRAASPMLRAMLSTDMREGARSEIELDCSSSTVQMFLALCYTGSLPEAEEVPSVATMLDALALGHRWQTQHVVEIIAPALAHRVDINNFESIMDTALRLQLHDLLVACRGFCSSHAREMRAKLAKQNTTPSRFTSAAVRMEVSHILGIDGGASTGTEQVQKRRRML